jgi:hypothetical protein
MTVFAARNPRQRGNLDCMGHLELILLATTSYLGSLWLIGRWRRWRGKPSIVSLAELGRPHLRRALDPVVKALSGSESGGNRSEALLAALEAGDLEKGRSLQRDLMPALDAPKAALLEAAIGLVAAGLERSAFSRHRLAVRSLRAARQARSLGIEAIYLEVLVLLDFLSDGLTEDVRLLQSRRLLKRAAGRASEDSLVQLALALRSAVAGQQAESIAALARAFYHARGDRFVAGRILAAPFVEELSPSLMEEARHALADLSPPVPGFHSKPVAFQQG